MAKVVGDELMTRYVIAFEVAGLLLTAALVGAIALAHREEIDPAAVARQQAAIAGRGDCAGRRRAVRPPRTWSQQSSPAHPTSTSIVDDRRLATGGPASMLGRRSRSLV